MPYRVRILEKRGVGVFIDADQNSTVHPGITLRGGQIGVTEAPLERAQVTAAVEQSGGKAAAQGVGHGAPGNSNRPRKWRMRRWPNPGLRRPNVDLNSGDDCSCILASCVVRLKRRSKCERSPPEVPRIRRPI